MARVLNFAGYFVGSICWVCVTGLTSRKYPYLLPWYWGFLILFILALIGVGSFYGRKAYAGVLDTSEPIIIGLVIILFFGSIVGGIASHV
jgi:hypothetical protein